MGRPRKGVTLENIHKISHYFYRAFKTDRLHSNGWFKNSDLLYEAREGFEKLPAIDWKSNITKKTTTADRLIALQKWIDKYIADDKWQRCLLTLRQDKSRQKLKLRQLNLPSDVYLTVKILAQKKEITMGEVVRQLAEPALNKIYSVEYKKELNISNKKLGKNN